MSRIQPEFSDDLEREYHLAEIKKLHDEFKFKAQLHIDAILQPEALRPPKRWIIPISMVEASLVPEAIKWQTPAIANKEQE